MSPKQNKEPAGTPLQVGETIKIPEGETPHLFLTPDRYLGEGFTVLPLPKIMRSQAGQGRILSAEMRGTLPTPEGNEVQVISINTPGLFARGVAKIRKRPAQTKIKRTL